MTKTPDFKALGPLPVREAIYKEEVHRCWKCGHYYKSRIIYDDLVEMEIEQLPESCSKCRSSIAAVVNDKKIRAARWFLEGWVRVLFTLPVWQVWQRPVLRRADGKLISEAQINRRIKKAIERHNRACYLANRHYDCIFSARETSAWRNRK